MKRNWPPKTGFVRDAFARLGGLDVPVAPALAAPLAQGYRNKVQLPVGRRADGRIVTGFYAGRSHRIIETPGLQTAAGLDERAGRAGLRAV